MHSGLPSDTPSPSQLARPLETGLPSFCPSGTLTVEQIYQDRDQFAKLVREVAAPDVGRMGIEILSFTIKVRDRSGADPGCAWEMGGMPSVLTAAP